MKTPLILLLCLPFWLQAQIVVDSTASLRGVSVLNQNVVWVSGSNATIAKTEDGGKTWSKVEIPDTEGMDFRDVEVFSASEVLVMSAGEGSKSNIYRTEDGGKTWNRVYANQEPKGFFNGFSFNSKGKGVLTGDPVDGKLFVLKTSNGEKWRRVNPNKLPMLAQGEAGGFAASGSHLYLGDDFFVNGTGGRMSRVLMANSSLSTWKPIYLNVIQGESSQGIFSIDFCDGQNGVAVGGDYTQTDSAGQNNVMITEDGGEVWVPADNFPVYQSAVRYIDCDRVIATGPGGTYISKDGGYSWSKTDFPGFHTLDIASDGSIWAAGSGGRVMNIKL